MPRDALHWKSLPTKEIVSVEVGEWVRVIPGRLAKALAVKNKTMDICFYDPCTYVLLSNEDGTPDTTNMVRDSESVLHTILSKWPMDGAKEAFDAIKKTDENNMGARDYKNVQVE